jgi:hypothetical protein
MKYLRIRTDYDPKITGKRDGAFTVEKNQKSFTDKMVEKEFNAFTSENFKNIERISYRNYEIFKIVNGFFVTYFPRTKSIKELDFMAYGPNIQGIRFLISQRAFEIISKYKLPTHNKIPVKIDTFKMDYYLTGFPMFEISDYDLEKTIFLNKNRQEEIIFNDIEALNKYYDDIGWFNIEITKITLRNKLNYDIINTASGIFFSPKIIEEYKNKNITGYKIENGILEN